MPYRFEIRSASRITCRIPIIVEDCKTQALSIGLLLNCNKSGLYFECDVPLNFGTEIYCSIKNLPFKFPPGIFKAHIRWCHILKQPTSLRRYGIGAEFFRELDLARSKKRFRVIEGGLSHKGQKPDH